MWVVAIAVIGRYLTKNKATVTDVYQRVVVYAGALFVQKDFDESFQQFLYMFLIQGRSNSMTGLAIPNKLGAN